MIDKILKFLAGVFGGRALSEGGGFGVGQNGNIAAADFSSGLGLRNYEQDDKMTSRAGGQDDNSQRRARRRSRSRQPEQPEGSDGYDLINLPRKRRRLLLEGSPNKAASQLHQEKGAPHTSSSIKPQVRPAYATSLSQFEEIQSEEGEDDDIPIGEDVESSTGIRSITTSPPLEAAPQFDGLEANSQQQNTRYDLANVDWPAVSAYLSNNDNNTYNFSDPSFNNFFSLPPTSTSSESTVLPPIASTSLGVSTSGPYPPPVSIQQANDAGQPTAKADQNLTKYDAVANNMQNQELKIKKRMDSLSEAIDKLVAQLPEGFDFSTLQNGSDASVGNGTEITNGIGANDEFDFSQYRRLRPILQ